MRLLEPSLDKHRLADLRLYDAVGALVNDSPRQAAEAFHEVYKLFYEVGYTDEYFMQSRERALLLAEMDSDVLVTINPDGSKNSLMRVRLLAAEMELGKESITLH